MIFIQSHHGSDYTQIRQNGNKLFKQDLFYRKIKSLIYIMSNLLIFRPEN